MKLSKLSPAEQTVFYLVAQVNKEKKCAVGRTYVMKLLYLADLIAKHRLGETITGACYRCCFFGPYSGEIEEAIVSLVEKGLLHDTPVLTNAGLAHNYTADTTVELFLEARKRAILDEVVLRFGCLNLREILEAVFSSPPMRKAQPEQVVLT